MQLLTLLSNIFIRIFPRYFRVKFNKVKKYWWNYLLLISFLFINKPSVASCCLHITCIAKVKSGERYPNRVVNFVLNRAYIKIRTPNSCCTDNTWFFEYFYGFLGFVVWEISEHFGGVYQSRYCASDGAFLFSFVSKYCFWFAWKANKVKMGNELYLRMIFICVRLIRLHLHDCHHDP